QTDFWDDYQHLKRETSMLRDSVQRLNVIRGRYHALMDSPGVFVAFLDNEGRFLDINLGGLSLLGMDAREVVGMQHVQVFSGEPSRAIGGKASEAIRTGQTVDFAWSLTTRNGTVHQLSATASPVRDETGTVVAACVIAFHQQP
ncbi:MAG: PAS domain-containing protein, partial [bacterium]